MNYREVKERQSYNSERADNLNSVKKGPKKQEIGYLGHTNETFSDG